MSLLAFVCLATVTVAAIAPASASTLLSGFAALKRSANDSVPYSVAASDPKPAVVEFYAEWCSVCRSMAPTMAELHNRYGERINFVMLDIDDPQWSQQARDFSVVGVPYFAFLSSPDQETGDRQLQQTLVGGHPMTIVTESLERLLDSTGTVASNSSTM